MNLPIGKTLALAALLFSTHAFATTYLAPSADQSLIGEVQYSTTEPGDSAASIAKKHDLGFNAIKNANPQLDVNRAFASGQSIQLPTQHLLPNLPREGIVVNLPEMRMYYYPKGSNQVFTYPIGIGKIGKTIPITLTSITKKVENPVWIPPQDIREFNLAQGIVLPKIMPAGPDNPLGPYAIYMQVPTYLIHSTIFPESIGTRASFGCIRMYPDDIKTFFPTIEKGIPVAIINSPIKINWQNDHLYMEAYHPLEEHGDAYETSLPGIVHEITNTAKNQTTLVDWQLVSYVAVERDGIPHDIGIKMPTT